MPGRRPVELATIVPLLPVPMPEIEALLDRAFGAERRARTAYRLRERATAIETLSFAAYAGEQLVGSLQSWPVALRDAEGGLARLVMVGPVAVLPECQGEGIGTALMEACTSAADRDGISALMMIGDPDYYRRFGFSAEATGAWQIDGPYEQHRLLARVRGPVPAVGTLLPWAAVTAAESEAAIAA